MDLEEASFLGDCGRGGVIMISPYVFVCNRLITSFQNASFMFRDHHVGHFYYSLQPHLGTQLGGVVLTEEMAQKGPGLP